jgi:hypothetical protein
MRGLWIYVANERIEVLVNSWSVVNDFQAKMGIVTAPVRSYGILEEFERGTEQLLAIPRLAPKIASVERPA